jgi:hypothetical protein
MQILFNSVNTALLVLHKRPKNSSMEIVHPGSMDADEGFGDPATVNT